jgi:salicylate hydroxylase
MNAM